MGGSKVSVWRGLCLRFFFELENPPGETTNLIPLSTLPFNNTHALNMAKDEEKKSKKRKSLVPGEEAAAAPAAEAEVSSNLRLFFFFSEC